jgi:hypothetical protein
MYLMKQFIQQVHITSKPESVLIYSVPDLYLDRPEFKDNTGIDMSMNSNMFLFP